MDWPRVQFAVGLQLAVGGLFGLICTHTEAGQTAGVFACGFGFAGMLVGAATAIIGPVAGDFVRPVKPTQERVDYGEGGEL